MSNPFEVPPERVRDAAIEGYKEAKTLFVGPEVPTRSRAERLAEAKAILAQIASEQQDTSKQSLSDRSRLILQGLLDEIAAERREAPEHRQRELDAEQSEVEVMKQQILEQERTGSDVQGRVGIEAREGWHWFKNQGRWTQAGIIAGAVYVGQWLWRLPGRMWRWMWGSKEEGKKGFFRRAWDEVKKPLIAAASFLGLVWLFNYAGFRKPGLGIGGATGEKREEPESIQKPEKKGKAPQSKSESPREQTEPEVIPIPPKPLEERASPRIPPGQKNNGNRGEAPQGEKEILLDKPPVRLAFLDGESTVPRGDYKTGHMYALDSDHPPVALTSAEVVAKVQALERAGKMQWLKVIPGRRPYGAFIDFQSSIRPHVHVPIAGPGYAFERREGTSHLGSFGEVLHYDRANGKPRFDLPSDEASHIYVSISSHDLRDPKFAASDAVPAFHFRDRLKLETASDVLHYIQSLPADKPRVIHLFFANEKDIMEHPAVVALRTRLLQEPNVRFIQPDPKDPGNLFKVEELRSEK